MKGGLTNEKKSEYLKYASGGLQYSSGIYIKDDKKSTEKSKVP
jgi:hypothetical protein